MISVEQPAEPERSLGRILLVEDEEHLRQAVAGELARHGYTVETCRDGSEGFSHYAAHQDEIDLVIMSMVLPRMNGRHAAAKIMELNPRARVLIAAGMATEAEIREMMGMGVKGVVPKPYDLPLLADKVKAVLEEKTR